jgi:phage-related minor tail protein
MVNFVMTGKLNFKDLANSIIADIARIIIRQELSNALGIGGSSGSGGSSMVAGFFKSILGFAGGGSPPVGRASIVGEAGPELFIPSSSGTIVPNSAFGGGNRMVVNIVESPGQGGQQSRATSNGVDTLTIMVEKIKSSIAGDIKNGSGAIPAAMSSTYGMNRTVGAF